ncbi:MAG: bacterial Ig-like domain-containing protein, partial [Eubacterium sp.]
MTNAYSTAVVTVKADAGVQNVARLVGQAAANSTFNSCYALEGIKAVNGNETLGAVSKTEAEMKTQATYKDWAFNSIWQMSSSYPEFYIPKSGAIQVEMPNTTYYTGEKLNLFNGYLVINGTKIEMTENMLAPFDSTTAGEKTVTGSYKGVPFSFKVTVKAPGVVTELTVNKAAKVDYIEGQFFDQTGAVLMATIDGSPYHYLYSGFSVNQTEALKPSDQSVTYTYGGATVSQAINVTPKTVVGISVIQRPEVKAGGYYVGDKLELKGLRAQLVYNDGSQSEVMAFDTLEAAGIHVSHQLDTTLDLTNLPNLKETDNGTSLYVYYGDKKPSESGAVYAEIMKLEVKKGLWLDDQVVEMSVGVDSTGIKTEAVEGGSGRYKVELKSGQYPKGITKNDVWLPGHS